MARHAFVFITTLCFRRASPSSDDPGIILAGRADLNRPSKGFNLVRFHRADQITNIAPPGRVVVALQQ
jgi:hypothetical protein